MTTETATETKKAPPAEVAYKLDTEGKFVYSTRTAVWGSKTGKVKNITINGERWAIVPNKAKAAAAEGKGA